MFRLNREFQAGLKLKEVRRQREDKALSLRRKDRELKLQIKRKKTLNNNSTQSSLQQHPITVKLKNSSNSTQASLQELPVYVKGCFAEHKVSIYDCCKKIRQLLSVKSGAPIQQVFDSGVIPRIMQLLAWNDCPRIQFECIWILINITSDKPEYTATVVRNGAIPLMSNILKIQKYPLQEQAIWTLGNIAGDSAEFRDMIINTDVLQIFLLILDTGFKNNYFWEHDPQNKSSTATAKQQKLQYTTLLCALSWTLSNLCRNATDTNTTNDMYVAVIKCTYYLFFYVKSLGDDDTNDINEILHNIGWVYSFLTRDRDFSMADNTILDTMNEHGITEDLIKLINHNQAYLPCIRAIGNILAGHDNYTQICIDYGVLQSYYNLFNKSNESTVLKELCWSISNITAGSQGQIDAVAAYGIFPILCQLLANSQRAVSNQALYALGNAACSAETVYYLCDECNLIQSLCIYNKNNFVHNSYLKSMGRVLFCSLDCVESILQIDSKFALLFECHGGVDFLEYIQSVESISQEIYEKTVAIIQQHFGGDSDANILNNNENDDTNISYSDPQNNRQFSNQFGFGLNDSNNNNDSFQF